MVSVSYSASRPCSKFCELLVADLGEAVLATSPAARRSGGRGGGEEVGEGVLSSVVLIFYGDQLHPKGVTLSGWIKRKGFRELKYSKGIK